MPSDPSDLRATGDALQSALSRLAEYLRNIDWTDARYPPYEVRMATVEARSAIDQWTELRRQDATPKFNVDDLYAPAASPAGPYAACEMCGSTTRYRCGRLGCV